MITSSAFGDEIKPKTYDLITNRWIVIWRENFRMLGEILSGVLKRDIRHEFTKQG